MTAQNAKHTPGLNNSRVGDKVICNGYPGTVVRTKDSPGSAWMLGMVEVRLERGLVCVPDRAPDVVQP